MFGYYSLPLYLLIQEDLYPCWLVGSKNPVILWLQLWVLVVGVGGCRGECMERSVDVFVGGLRLRHLLQSARHSREPVVDVNKPPARTTRSVLPWTPSSTPAALGLQKCSLRSVAEAVGVPFPPDLCLPLRKQASWVWWTSL